MPTPIRLQRYLCRASLVDGRHSRDTMTAMADAEIITCPACGTGNRVPRVKLTRGLRPVCGRCGMPFRPLDGPAVVAEEA